jgi:carbamoyltransferase
MRILGMHDGHNASACLLEDGWIKYCIQEERLTNTKNYFGFPSKSIEKILALANIDAEELDFVAIKRSSEVGCK